MPFQPPNTKQPDLAAILQTLNQSDTQTKNNSLYQAVLLLIKWLQIFRNDVLKRLGLLEVDSGIVTYKRKVYNLNNDDIINLPTLGYTLIQDFTIGKRIKIISVSARVHIEGVYTGIDPIAWLGIVTNIGGVPVVTPIVNDGLSYLDDFLSLATYDLVHDFLVPAVYDNGGGYITPWYASPLNSGADAYNGVGVKLFLDNNGMGNLSVGDANNRLTIVLTWTEERI